MDPLDLTGMECGGVNCDSSRGHRSRSQLIQQFRCNPAELLRMFEKDEEIYLEDLEHCLVEGSTRLVLVAIVQAQILA